MKYLMLFNLLYLFIGGLHFWLTDDGEFVIYVGVIFVLLALVCWVHTKTAFPKWMLWLFSIWGLMHVLGGAVDTQDGVLFAYRIYPFVDAGGELYILKYDQVVHGYLYGVVALMAQHVLRILGGMKSGGLLVVAAILVSLGISSLNEIMEYFISLTMENGVGGYHNTMLDMCFNLGGAVGAIGLAKLARSRKHN